MTKNVFLFELYKVANIVPDTIGAYAVGFQIGPRINAPGRIDHATKSFELLVAEDSEEAKELAQWLNHKNEERQGEMDVIETEAVEMITKNELDRNKVIIASGKWTKGVIGPTASRLVERYGRPVILFSEGAEEYTGSARSVSGVNIVELIETVKELVGKYGGHKGAAGLTVSSQDFKKFTKELVKSANATISDEDLVKKINIDAEVGLSEMTFEILARLNEFEPFGMGNIKPVFASSHVLFDDFRFVGKNANHFSAIAKNNNTKIKSIYFNFPFDKSMIKYDENYSIAFTLSQDEWNGNKKLSLNILDIKEDNL